MYSIKYNIPNQDVTIERAIFSLSYRFLDNLGLDTDIIFKNEIEDREIKNPDGAYNKNFTKWFDHIEATYSVDTTMDTNMPIVKGPKNVIRTESGISVDMELFKYKVSVNFKVFSKSKSALIDLKNKLLDLRVDNSYPIANVKTDVYLPLKILDLLSLDFKYRNEVEPITAEEYFSKILSSNFEILTSQDKLFKELAYRFILTNVMLKQENLEESKLNKESDELSYSLEFSINSQLDLPRKMILNYYPILYSNLLPDEWHSLFTEPQVEPKTVNDVLNRLFSTRNIPFCYIPKVFERKYMTIPVNDCCILPDVDGYHNFLTGLSIPKSRVINDNEYTDMDLSINDLGDVKLNPVVLEFIKEYREDINKPFKLLFLLNVYKDFKPIPHRLYYLDDNLDIIIKETFDVKSIYHFSLAIAGDDVIDVVLETYEMFKNKLEGSCVNLASSTGNEEISGNLKDSCFPFRDIDIKNSIFNTEFIYKLKEAKKRGLPMTQQNAYTIANVLEGV